MDDAARLTISPESENGKTELQKSYFDVLGICCSSEVPLIQSIMKSLDGVQDVQVIVPTKTVIVLHDPLVISQLQIVGALNKAKLEASVREERGRSTKKRWPNPFTIASGVLLSISFLKYVYHPLQWLALGAVALVIYPIALRAFTAVRHLTFGNIHILVLITVVGSIALKDYLEAGAIVFLFTIAEWLESLASEKANAAMSSLVNLLPQKAVLAETGEEVDVSQLDINTVISVKEGQIVPVDGVVVEGNCEVDEKSLSGESFPVSKQNGSMVWAGTINVNGYITMRTTTLAEDCVLARMTKLVEEAHGKKSQIQRYIDKCSKYYTPAIILISALLAIIPAALKRHNQKEWFHIALVLLVSACPCALILSTPIAMFCALTKAAKHGVFFKGADCLETLAKVKIMAFDKTGTVTRAEFEVIEFRSLLDEISLNTLLYWVSSIQSKSSHPIAAALVEFAQSKSVQPKPDEVKNYQNFPGEGIYGRISDREIHIGNWKISARAGCNSAPKLEGDIYEGKSVGYVFSGSTPVGIFCLADNCRIGAKEALKELQSMGIKTAMLTGDCSAAAKHAEDQQLGGALEVVHADLLPEDKATYIKDFQKVSRTAMIGDGINDALALATADIGISMGISGSALATETGDVILMTNDIQRVPKVARLARRVIRKILENMIVSVAAKGSVIALAIAGHPVVWAAVLADVGTCLLVILNSMLLLRDREKGPMDYCKSAALSHAREDMKRSGSDSRQSKKPCCGEIGSQDSHEALICSVKNSNQIDPSCASSSNSLADCERLCSNEKQSCCQNGKESRNVNCSNSAGIVRCCNSTNNPGDSAPLADEFGDNQVLGSNGKERCCGNQFSDNQVLDSNDKKGCCGNQKRSQLAKCSNSAGVVKCCNSIKTPGDGTSLAREFGDNQVQDANGKKSCCGNGKQSQTAKCSNLGEGEYSISIKNHANSINIPGDDVSHANKCGDNQRSGNLNRQACCGSAKQSQKDRCCNSEQFCGSNSIKGTAASATLAKGFPNKNSGHSTLNVNRPCCSKGNPQKLENVQICSSRTIAPACHQSVGSCDDIVRECCSKKGHCGVISITFIVPVRSGDLEALLALKASVDPLNKLSWGVGNGNGNVCDWEGVRECKNGRVTKLVVERFGLIGELDQNSLNQLDQLRVLSFKENSISGQIPSLSGLVNLKSLYLNDNNFSGDIPSTISRLHRLKVVVLANNHISGHIPDSLLKLPRLYELYLQNNSLTGEIPPFRQSGLRFFNVSNNQLSGSIPSTPVLARFNESSFSNNVDLCGDKIDKPCKNPTDSLGPSISPSYPILPENQNHHKRTKKLIIILVPTIVGGLILAAAAAMAFVFCIRRSRDSTRESRTTKSAEARRGGGSEAGATSGSGGEGKSGSGGGGFSWEEGGSRAAGGSKPLHWTSCLKIAEDLATGLLYIHQNPGLVHGNLKSSNVLLGSDFESCLTDYSLTSFRNPDSLEESSASSLFYRAPECRDTRRPPTQQADVYSFGVLLLELLTGKTPFQDLVQEHGSDIPKWVKSVREEETESGDEPASSNEASEEKLAALLSIAMACVSLAPDNRPTMRDVLRMIREARAEAQISSNSSDHSPGRWSDTVQSLPRDEHLSI
ncbi:OLC1v1033198C1 [Oldenlandia corymbosa var. corymbosa]|uniref:OLC1v1033198C1 n=1 Tax=Oldenlandia corymbosa var. corymbosa TaxID=529605 RepID=A0AAV1CMN9_OLDCO|nr:OLC1v1033198C1 [Oldenlandia corymbosa var. corymbosa]